VLSCVTHYQRYLLSIPRSSHWLEAAAAFFKKSPRVMDPVDLLHQGCANSGRQFFFLRWSLLFASAQYENLLNVTLLAPRILRLIIDFLKICGLLYYYMMISEGHKAVTLNLRYSWT
jgi:hypothetical protein